MEQIFVKPAEGRLLRNESGLRIPEDGMLVNRTTYMNRRIKKGDAVVVTEKKKRSKIEDTTE